MTKKFKIPKWLKAYTEFVDKWTTKAEHWARVIVWVFGIILAGVATAAVLPLLVGNILYWVWIAAFFIFLIAALVVLVCDAKGVKQKGRD